MHNKSELDEIIANLPELWADYCNHPVRGHACQIAIAQVAKAIGAKGSRWWNKAIAWLDASHPSWRGYPAPEVREVA